MPNEKVTRGNACEERIMQNCIRQLNEKFDERFNLKLKEAIDELTLKHEDELEALKVEIKEIKTSQEFICANYDNLKKEYDLLRNQNKQQADEIQKLRSNSKDLEKQSEVELNKIDQLEQYGRRQNLEFHGVPEEKDEDPTEIVMKICNTIGVSLERKEVSIAHRLPKKRNEDKPPAIIAKFISAETRNNIYKKRKQSRNLDKNIFPIAGMMNLYINENLTQSRKRLLWKTKQAMKCKDYQFIWTRNGKIFVRREATSDAILIESEYDICKL